MWNAVLPLAVALAIATAPPAASQVPSNRQITVSGEGRAAASPDRASVTVGIETRDSSADAALEANSRSTDKVIDAVREAGVARENIRTARISVRRQRRDLRAGPHPRLYVVTNALRVGAAVDRIGSVLDAAVAAGADSVRGIEFRISDEAVLAERALERAFADARRRAERLADAAGASLGKVLTIREDPGRGPRPLATASNAAAPVPVEGGSQEITASVTVTWRLAD